LQVFEPSEIRERFLTEDDDLIRAQDVPERMQLATSALSATTSLASHTSLAENDLEAAAVWVVNKLDREKRADFFEDTGRYHHLLGDLLSATQTALRFLFVQHFEVPYIWVHRRDWISYFNPQDMRTRVDFLTFQELWRVQSLGEKYRALIERRNAVDALYARLNVDDEYFVTQIRQKLDSAETVADAIEWLNMKYKEHKRDFFGSALDGGEDTIDAPKHKLPSRVSAYEVARKSVVSKLADVGRPDMMYVSWLTCAQEFGARITHVVLNYQTQRKDQLIDDYPGEPEAFAEEFVETGGAPDAETALIRARMILATELGKDPILRQEVRKLFKAHALVSCSPTDRGIAKIDEHNPFFVSSHAFGL
jgi:transcription elongation factor SPT6